MIIIRGQETDVDNTVISTTGLSDIVSQLCDLPTGVFSLEFMPKHEVSLWENGLPRPTNRWYGIGVYRDTLTFVQHSEDTEHGFVHQVTVGCKIINDSQQVADQLQQMGNMHFVLRITHYDGKVRIVGLPGEYCKLDATDYNPDEIVGAQGYLLNFSARFTRRPILV
jgi:hypothetical protein